MMLCLYFYVTPSLESSSVTANDFDNTIIVRLFLITISIRRRIRSSRRENRITLWRGERGSKRSTVYAKRESMDLFGEKNGPSIIMEFKNNYIDVIRRGGGIRLITEITNENLHYCKGLVNIVTELRHLEGLIGGIAVSESEYMSTTTLRWKQLLTQVFYSSAEEVVKQGQYIFDTF